MNRREKWMVAAVVSTTVVLTVLSYLFDQWVLAADIPDWLKGILLHGAG